MLPCSHLPYLYEQLQWLSDGVFVTSKWNNPSEVLRKENIWHLNIYGFFLLIFHSAKTNLFFFFSKWLPLPFVSRAKVYSIVSGVGGHILFCFEFNTENIKIIDHGSWIRSRSLSLIHVYTHTYIYMHSNIYIRTQTFCYTPWRGFMLHMVLISGFWASVKARAPKSCTGKTMMYGWRVI